MTGKSWKERAIAWLLSFMMIFQLLPAVTVAEGNAENDDNAGTIEYVKVSFHIAEGNTIESASIQKGTLFSDVKESIEQSAGTAVLGWYTDKDFSQEVPEGFAFTEDSQLFAKIAQDEFGLNGRSFAIVYNGGGTGDKGVVFPVLRSDNTLYAEKNGHVYFESGKIWTEAKEVPLWSFSFKEGKYFISYGGQYLNITASGVSLGTEMGLDLEKTGSGYIIRNGEYALDAPNGNCNNGIKSWKNGTQSYALYSSDQISTATTLDLTGTYYIGSRDHIMLPVKKENGLEASPYTEINISTIEPLGAYTRQLQQTGKPRLHLHQPAGQHKRAQSHTPIRQRLA